MNTENLIGGAEAYTSLAEVADTAYDEVPEATPVVTSAVGSFIFSHNTVKLGC